MAGLARDRGLGGAWWACGGGTLPAHAEGLHELSHAATPQRPQTDVQVWRRRGRCVRIICGHGTLRCCHYPEVFTSAALWLLRHSCGHPAPRATQGGTVTAATAPAACATQGGTVTAAAATAAPAPRATQGGTATSTAAATPTDSPTRAAVSTAATTDATEALVRGLQQGGSTEVRCCGAGTQVRPVDGGRGGWGAGWGTGAGLCVLL